MSSKKLNTPALSVLNYRYSLWRFFYIQCSPHMCNFSDRPKPVAQMRCVAHMRWRCTYAVTKEFQLYIDLLFIIWYDIQSQRHILTCDEPEIQLLLNSSIRRERNYFLARKNDKNIYICPTMLPFNRKRSLTYATMEKKKWVGPARRDFAVIKGYN